MESINSVTTPDRSDVNVSVNDSSINNNDYLIIHNGVSKLKSLALSDSPAGVEDILNDSVTSINSLNSIDDNNSVSLIALPVSARNDNNNHNLIKGEKGESSQLIITTDLEHLDKRDTSIDVPSMLSDLYINEDDNDSSMSDIHVKQPLPNQMVITDDHELELDDDEVLADDSSDEYYDVEEHRKQASLARMWSEEMDSLINSRTLFEAASCINRSTAILNDLDEDDRLNYCKADFESSVETLRVERFPWWEELSGDIISVMVTYFDESKLKHMPEYVTQDIFLWLTVEDIQPISEVCSEWYELATDCILWTQLYERKFIKSNPQTWPSSRLQCGFKFRYLYQLRIRSPCIGDKVEVAWRGKFRLEAQEVYQGLAWWVAEVVDCHEEQNRYKIRYCGWDDDWDDWIPRDRLRWAVESNVVKRIHPNDNVELWCFGSNVPGAWLETKVTKIRGNRYYLDNQVIAQSGQMWVRRDRLRFVSRDAQETIDNDAPHVVITRGPSSQSLLTDGDENSRSGRHSFSQSFSSLTRSLSSRLSSFRGNTGGSSSSLIENGNDSSSRRGGSSRHGSRERAQSHSDITTTNTHYSSVRGTVALERRHSNGEVVTETPRHLRQRLDSAHSLIDTSPSSSRPRSNSRNSSRQFEQEPVVVDDQDPRLSNRVASDNRSWRQVRVSRSTSNFGDVDSNTSRRSSFDEMDTEADGIYSRESVSRASGIGSNNDSPGNDHRGSQRRRSRSNSNVSNSGVDRATNFERRNSSDRRERMDDSYDDRTTTTITTARSDRSDRSSSGRSRTNSSSRISRSITSDNNSHNNRRRGRRAVAPLRSSNTAPAIVSVESDSNLRRHGSHRGSCAIM